MSQLEEVDDDRSATTPSWPSEWTESASRESFKHRNPSRTEIRPLTQVLHQSHRSLCFDAYMNRRAVKMSH